MESSPHHHDTGSRAANCVVEISIVTLDEVEQNWPNWATVLEPAEIAKAARFVSPEDRRRSGVSRAVLRLLLGNRLRVDPGEVRFSYNAYGKPELPENLNREQLFFNLSHARDVVLIGIAKGHSIGVDVEWLGLDATFGDLASGICSPQEFADLAGLPSELRLPELLRYWTLKEAWVKAIGQGLSFPHREIQVQRRVGPNGTATYRVRGNDSWTPVTIDDLSGYVASVVIGANSATVRRQPARWPRLRARDR